MYHLAGQKLPSDLFFCNYAMRMTTFSLGVSFPLRTKFNLFTSDNASFAAFANLVTAVIAILSGCGSARYDREGVTANHAC